MGASLAVQKAIYEQLIADETLRAILADHVTGGSPQMPAVYDVVPQLDNSELETAFPYIAIGDHTAAESDDDLVNGEEATVTLHIWSRYQGKKEVLQIRDAIYDALHNASLTVQGQHVVYCFWEFAGSVPDEDMLVQHEVTRFRIVTQEA